MDTRIIAAMKIGYRAIQYGRVLDLSDEIVRNIYNIDQLTDIKWLVRVLVTLATNIVLNSWKLTGFLFVDKHYLVLLPVVENILSEDERIVEYLVSHLAAPEKKMHLNIILCAEDRNGQTEEFPEEVLVPGQV